MITGVSLPIDGGYTCRDIERITNTGPSHRQRRDSGAAA